MICNPGLQVHRQWTVAPYQHADHQNHHHSTNLDSKQKEIKIEITAREHKFVCHSHQNGGNAITENWEDGIVRNCAWSVMSRRRYRGLKVFPIAITHINSEIISFLIVCHCWLRC